MPTVAFAKMRSDFLEKTHFAERDNDVAEFLGIGESAAGKRIAESQKKLNGMWQTMDRSDPVKLTKFYNSEAFLLTRMRLDARTGPGKREMLTFLYSLKKKAKVIDYGAGIGSYSEWIAGRGCRVTAVEIEGMLMDWLKWRIDKYGLDIRLKSVKDVREIAAFRSRYYDALFMAGVLEHLPRPVRAVQQMVKAVKKGGRVFALLGGFPSRGHLPRSIKLMPTVRRVLESDAEHDAMVYMIGAK